MSKEIVVGIGRAIEEAQEAKILREEQEIVKRQAESLGQEAEHQVLIVRNEARLRASGVVDLFEELRDKKVLTMFKTGDPATISWDSDKTEIVIEFDKFGYYLPDSDGSRWTKRTKHLRAEISENGGLKIGEHEMKQGERLEDVVRDEILRLKGLRE